ncbi:hypothetical protein MRB53_027637 [Persea americana]|uniref:Uncharacterized protein n=1 Tax=Persea americana TaxID=3435 RepID=A0ACC2LLF6_PERAE|nr:hypothetical protein MRB53_027637 [Persea americana]
MCIKWGMVTIEDRWNEERVTLNQRALTNLSSQNLNGTYSRLVKHQPSDQKMVIWSRPSFEYIKVASRASCAGCVHVDVEEPSTNVKTKRVS